MIKVRDGWRLRTLDWPANGEARGTMLVQGGRGDFIEKYIEVLGHWHSRGWALSAFDWRGQGGSGRLSANAKIGHISDFSIWVDDLAERFEAPTASRPGPHVIVAHSMGGHLVLRALIEKRIAPDAVVLVAPMLGLNSAPLPELPAACIASLMASIFPPSRPAWAANEKPGVSRAGRQGLLTHSLQRYEDESWWKETDTKLALGPPSWQWLRAAYRSTMGSFASGALEKVDVPILLLCADQDRLVNPAAIRAAAKRLPDAKLVTFGDEAAHEILRETDPVRLRALAEIDAFLDEKAPRT